MMHAGRRQTVAAFVLGAAAAAGGVMLFGQRSGPARARGADLGQPDEVYMAETGGAYALCTLREPMRFVASDVKDSPSYTVHVVAMSPKGVLYGLVRRAGGVAKWVRLTTSAPM